MKKMKISQCPDSIAIKAFIKGKKRDICLFMELSKTTPYSVDVVYNKAQKFVNVEREMKPFKTPFSKSSDKSTTSKDSGDRKSFVDRHPNPSRFKPIITPMRRLGTWGRVLSPFREPPL